MDKVSPFPNKTEIKEEAAAWVIRLDQGDLSIDESEALKEWLTRSSFHKEYLLKLTNNWDEMNVMSELAELFPLRGSEHREDSSVIVDASPGWLSAINIPVATLAVAVLCVVLFYGVQTKKRSADLPLTASIVEDYYTAIGEQSSYRLEDGSTISMNTNSRIKVSFSDKRRTVRLLQGEANFQVVKDHERPFVVYVGTGMVWAVGTAFNVKLSSGAVDVIVTEGRVKVFADANEQETEAVLEVREGLDDRDKVIILDAGKSVRYSQIIDVVDPVSKEEMERKLAWHHGALIFKGETLEEAVEEISRYTEQRFLIIDDSIRYTRVGGHFKTNDIETLLATLSKGFNIKSEQISPNLIHLSAK